MRRAVLVLLVALLVSTARAATYIVATTGACWESVHSAPASKNDGVQFKDAGD